MEETGYTVIIQYIGAMPKETEVLLASFKHEYTLIQAKSFGFIEGTVRCFNLCEALGTAQHVARVLTEQSDSEYIVPIVIKDTFVVEGKTK